MYEARSVFYFLWEYVYFYMLLFAALKEITLMDEYWMNTMSSGSKQTALMFMNVVQK